MTSSDTLRLRVAEQVDLADSTSAGLTSLISLAIFLVISLAAAEAVRGIMDR